MKYFYGLLLIIIQVLAYNLERRGGVSRGRSGTKAKSESLTISSISGPGKGNKITTADANTEATSPRTKKQHRTIDEQREAYNKQKRQRRQDPEERKKINQVKKDWRARRKAEGYVENHHGKKNDGNAKQGTTRTPVKPGSRQRHDGDQKKLVATRTKDKKDAKMKLSTGKPGLDNHRSLRSPGQGDDAQAELPEPTMSHDYILNRPVTRSAAAKSRKISASSHELSSGSEKSLPRHQSGRLSPAISLGRSSPNVPPLDKSPGRLSPIRPPPGPLHAGRREHSPNLSDLFKWDEEDNSFLFV